MLTAEIESAMNSRIDVPSYELLTNPLTPWVVGNPRFCRNVLGFFISL